jgi:hypothetical protein
LLHPDVNLKLKIPSTRDDTAPLQIAHCLLPIAYCPLRFTYLKFQRSSPNFHFSVLFFFSLKEILFV